ncbi:MAG: allophanate hydrolase-related protein [Streptosporangiaceae bacterium]
MIDLAARALGGSVVAANDAFFAEKENLLKPQAPVFDPYSYGHKGKVIDGWETRRRRAPGHDWVIVRLGAAGVVRRVVVDTSFFTGNYPEFFTGNYPEECTVEACAVEGYPSPAELSGDRVEWVELMPPSPLEGDAHNEFAIEVARPTAPSRSGWTRASPWPRRRARTVVRACGCSFPRSSLFPYCSRDGPAREGKPMSIRTFINGTTMSGGATHHYLRGAPLLARIRTAPKYRLYAVRDSFPGLVRDDDVGVAVEGELYELSYEVMRDSLMPSEPADLELGLIEVEDGRGAFAMFLRPGVADRPDVVEISHFGGWRAYERR